MLAAADEVNKTAAHLYSQEACSQMLDSINWGCE